VKRRENGLSADAYAPLIDLIPQLADELLGVLRQAGIAAYALLEEPTEDPQALDRVYVDAAHQREAEDLLHDNVLREPHSGASSCIRDQSPTRGVPAVFVIRAPLGGFGG
jgi:hypothetical protein